MSKRLSFSMIWKLIIQQNSIISSQWLEQFSCIWAIWVVWEAPAILTLRSSISKITVSTTMTKLGGVMAINDIAVASWLAAYNLVTPTKLLMQISSRKRLSQNIACPSCATPVPYQIQPYHVCLDLASRGNKVWCLSNFYFHFLGNGPYCFGALPG